MGAANPTNTTPDPTARAQAIGQARALLADLDENGIGDDERTLARTVARLEATVADLLDARDQAAGNP